MSFCARLFLDKKLIVGLTLNLKWQSIRYLDSCFTHRLYAKKSFKDGLPELVIGERLLFGSRERNKFTSLRNIYAKPVAESCVNTKSTYTKLITMLKATI
jgi:hypothetical protein